MEPRSNYLSFSTKNSIVKRRCTEDDKKMIFTNCLEGKSPTHLQKIIRWRSLSLAEEQSWQASEDFHIVFGRTLPTTMIPLTAEVPCVRKFCSG